MGKWKVCTAQLFGRGSSADIRERPPLSSSWENKKHVGRRKSIRMRTRFRYRKSTLLSSVYIPQKSKRLDTVSVENIAVHATRMACKFELNTLVK